jgi:hypothetical protein
MTLRVFSNLDWLQFSSIWGDMLAIYIKKAIWERIEPDLLMKEVENSLAIEGNDDPMHLCRCSMNRVEESTFPIICHTYSASEVETCEHRTASLTLRIHRLTENCECISSGAQMNSTYLLREAYRTLHLGKNCGMAAWQMWREKAGTLTTAACFMQSCFKIWPGYRNVLRSYVSVGANIRSRSIVGFTTRLWSSATSTASILRVSENKDRLGMASIGVGYW